MNLAFLKDRAMMNHLEVCCQQAVNLGIMGRLEYDELPCIGHAHLHSEASYRHSPPFDSANLPFETNQHWPGWWRAWLHEKTLAV